LVAEIEGLVRWTDKQLGGSVFEGELHGGEEDVSSIVLEGRHSFQFRFEFVGAIVALHKTVKRRVLQGGWQTRSR